MSSAERLSELEFLRSQVAELSRALAERDQSMSAQCHHLEEMKQDFCERSHLLRTIIEGPAAEIGYEFFAALVTHLTSVLHMQYAVIGEVCEGPLKKIRTLAVSAGGTLVDNFEYELAHTPCATALTQSFTSFDRDVQARFPQFQRLVDLEAESYCAVPLQTKGGAVMGLLVVMDTKPLQQGNDLQSLLGILAPRIVAEFERRRAEEERAQALADLHNVMETVPDVMFTLDTQGNMVKWNRRVGDITGYSPEELLNKPALAFVPLEEQPHTAAAIQRAFTEGYAELEGHLLTKEHRLIPYHWSGALLKNPHGEPIGITGVGRDVSDKKRAEAELRQQRRHLIDAQALAHLGSWRWDIDTGKGEWSDELFRIFGYEPGAIADTYDTFLASLHSDDQALVLAAINAALLGTCPYDVEYRIVRPNGEVRFIHARGDVYRDATGHPLSMAGSALDITERKRIEDALRASEERWQLAVRGSNDGIWDWNVQSGDIFFSPRWKAMRGFEDHEIKNHIDEWRSRIHFDDLDRVLQSLDAYFAKQRPEFCEEYRVQRKDGSYMWILDRGVALWADNGTPLRMAGSETDITARKGAEEALIRNRDLMKSFVEHTPAGVAMLDKGLRYVAVSRRWLEDYQLGHQQLIGRHHYDVFPEIKDMKEWQEIHQRCLSGAVERCEEDHFTRADGSEDWLRWEVRPWHDITGEIGGIIMFTEVLTERKQAYSLLQATINSTADGLLVVNRQGKVTSVNQQFLELWRIPQDLAERREEESLLAFVLEQLQEPEAFLTKVRELYSRPEQESFDMLAFKDGRGFECNSRPQILDKDIVGRVWSFHDITARQRTEKALRESEERFALAIEGSTDILWDAHRLHGEPWYAPQTPIWWSPRVRELLGLEESESFETLEQWVVRLHPDDKDHVFGQLAAHIEHRVPYDAEYRLRTNRGDYRWIRGRGEAMWDKEGEVRRMSGSCQDITDRKQVEEALRRSERQLRTVLDALPVGVWFTDQSGKPVLSNSAAKQIWCDIKQVGIEAASNTTGWWEAIGSSSELHRWALSHALTKGIPSLNETLELECLDGTKKTIRNATVPVLDEAGIVLGAIVLNEDITALRQAQEALKLTQFSVDHAVEGFFWIGPDARILNVNDAACRMLEYTRDELTTMTVYDLDPNLSPVLWSARWEVVKQRGSMTFEAKQWSKTGRVLDAEVTVNYLDYEGKEYNCAIVRDIGERKQAEMSLRQSEERYRSLVDNAPIGIFVNDAGRFVYANREMQRILNAPSAEQLIGTPVLERIAPEFHSVVKDRIHKLTKGQPVQLIDEKFVRLDGLRVDVAVTAIPTSFDGTTVIQVLVLDITDRKRMEETLRQRERDLHVVIEERERISQDLHDGVLQSLFAVGLTLESAKLMMSPKSRKMLGQPIDQAIAQLNCVMHEIRNFIARLGSDLLKGKDLRMALRHMLKLLRQIQDTRVRLLVEDRATQALSTEQSLHLLLVIQEAVSNCIRHGRAQEATVSLKLLKQGVRLSVRDNGCGFNPKAARRTGHGLTNMAARTQKMGGRLTVMSKVNEGTCIVLDLPKEVSSVCY